MKKYATGMTGTIGQHLISSLPLSGRLYPYTFNLSSLEENSNLIHLAGIVGIDKVNAVLDSARKINVEGTARLASDFKKHCKGKFILVSSSHVYADSPSKLSENSSIEPHSNYALMKLEAEQACVEIFKEYPERLLIARVFSVLGYSCNSGSLAAAIKNSILTGEPVSNGHDIRDFLSPKQVAYLLESLADSSSATGVVNVCSSLGLSVADVSRKFAEHLGEDQAAVNLSKSKTPYLVGENSRLLSMLGLKEIHWEFDDY